MTQPMGGRFLSGEFLTECSRSQSNLESRLTVCSVFRQTALMKSEVHCGFQFNVVRPICPQLVIALLLITSVVLWPTRGYAANGEVVGKAYTTQATDVARRVVIAELVKRPERIHRMTMKCTFKLDKQGHPHNIKVVSSGHNEWAEQTAHRAIAAAKFPPLPKSLIQQSGSDLATIEYKLDLNEPR